MEHRYIRMRRFWATMLALAVITGAAKAETPEDRNNAANLRKQVHTVFVLFQENRSFDHYFGTFPGADGLFSDGNHPRSAAETPGFVQPIINTDGTTGTISPFHIGTREQAADLGDPTHAQASMIQKMDLVNDLAKMDRYALIEEARRTPAGQKPSLQAKQFAELNMAYVDCDTIPFLWRYARDFTLFDHMFQTEIGPSTPNAIAVIAGQAGETQRALHPEQTNVPLRGDPLPFWGSIADLTKTNRQPQNPKIQASGTVGPNLTFANLMLLLAGQTLPGIVAKDRNAAQDLADVQHDVAAIGASGKPAFDWEWYQEGYDKEPNEPAAARAGGSHAAYVAHHNGPQYFGYISNNPSLAAHEHGLGDFFDDLTAQRIPQTGLVYVRGGYGNIVGLKPPAAPGLDPNRFQGDDDHPGYSDSQISESLVAREINAIARSPYWAHSAIVVIYDESGGFYDHVAPKILNYDEKFSALSRGPRFPMILISPFARDHRVEHEAGDHNALLAFVERLFGLRSLQSLPDEQRARMKLIKNQFAAPRDGESPDIIAAAFDPARLAGHIASIPSATAIVPDDIVNSLPHYQGKGCKMLGIAPEDARQGIHTTIPADFSPRP